MAPIGGDLRWILTSRSSRFAHHIVDIVLSIKPVEAIILTIRSHQAKMQLLSANEIEILSKALKVILLTANEENYAAS